MSNASAEQIAAVRRFNRFYTREVGLLRKTFLDTPWTLGEMRVLFEIANGDGLTASDMARTLELDAAYLSRMLRGFETKGLIARTQSKADARVSHLKLTAKGRAMFDPANQRQVQQTRSMLERLGPADRSRLIEAMATIEGLLGGEAAPKPAPKLSLRRPKAGDFGWIVTINAELYAREYGWGGPFEGLCAQIVADFVNDLDPEKERCWIAEADGERVGCIMLVRDEESGDPDGVARIRLLALDAKARGLGLGERLVRETIRFSRAAGYRRIVLWTHSVLTVARGIYAKTGFVKTGEEDHESWGRKVTSEFWELEL